MRKILDNKVFKIIYGIIRFCVFAILILYVGVLMFQRFSNNKDIMGYRVFTIATGSMEPVYDVGDVIAVHNTDFASLNVGDDITYIGKVADFDGKIVTHRIVKIDKDEKKITTRGVANDADDPAISEDQIFGKVTHKFVLLSILTKLTRNKYGFYFLIFVPLVLVIFLEIADLVTKVKDDDEDEEREEEK